MISISAGRFHLLAATRQNNKMKNKLIQLACALIATLGLGLGTAHAAEAAQPEVVGLMFHSDTCGSCKVLNPKLDSVKSGYLAKPILFVTLDHTSDGTKNQAALMAGALGVKEAYAAQEKASGFLLLVDKDSGEVLGKVTRDMTEAEIAATIDKAIAKG